MTGKSANFTQARLPRELEENKPTIARMAFGQSAYTVPWAMWADQDRLLWLHPDYEVHARTGGTVKMRIELREDGYHVWAPKSESWKPQGKSGYVGELSQPFIPVAALHVTE
jgi:hypothetical protein